MVVKILADTGNIMNHFDSMLLQLITRSDTGKHQQLGRIIGAAADNDFLFARDRLQLPVLGILDCHRAVALKPDTMDAGMYFDAEVAAPAHHRIKVTRLHAGALPVLHGKLIDADTFLAGTIEVRIGLMVQSSRRLDESIIDIEFALAVGYVKRSRRAVKLILTALIILSLAEIGQDIVVTPAVVAEFGPVVEIRPVAADIDHPVHTARSTQHLPARIVEAAVVERL